tara:strand:- start:561 stop:1943 length:1383 start_codon:yes stop_codon:yes gene_type:complete
MSSLSFGKSTYSCGNLVNLDCIDLDIQGNGLSKLNSEVFITPGLLPYEKATVRLLFRKKSFWLTELVNLNEKSNFRRDFPCKYAFNCGGCSLQHIHEEEQLRIKQKMIKDVFSRIAGINDFIPFIKYSESSFFHYRNRTILPVKFDFDNKFNIGYYQRGTHQVVDIDNCIILHPQINIALIQIKQILQTMRVCVSSDLIREPSIRHIAIKVSNSSSNLLVTLITNKKKLQNLSEISRMIYQIPSVSGVTQNIQPNNSNVLFGKRNIKLDGNDYVDDYICNMKFRIKPNTFFQVNHKLSETVIRSLKYWFKRSESNRIFDCYCGVGTLSIPLSSEYVSILGVDSNIDSVDQAKFNSMINNIKNANYIHGNVENLFSSLLLSTDFLILDPPRKGLNKQIIKHIKIIKPKSIAYLSCNPSTLARDLKELADPTIYKISLIQPYDFFPQTTHIETLTILNRLTP